MINKYQNISISIIGSGNVASHLALAFFTKGIKIDSIWSPNKQHCEALAKKVESKSVKSIKDIYKNSDFYIISVTDDGISEVLKNMPKVKGIVAHTSGTINLDVVSRYFNKSGVFYPLQTFSKNRDVNLKEVPFCIEANNIKILSELKDLAKILSDNVFEIDSRQRSQLHLAAVFVSNFVNYMYLIGDKILNENEISFELLKPLINEVVNKVSNLSPKEAQTGPARRKDLHTIKNHEKLLKEMNKDYLKIYRLLTAQIIKEYYEL